MPNLNFTDAKYLAKSMKSTAGAAIFLIFTCCCQLVVAENKAPGRIMSKTILPTKLYDPDYEWSLCYAVLYDSSHGITTEYKNQVNERLRLMETIILRESLGKIRIKACPVFIDVQKFGDTALKYDYRGFFDWIEKINPFLNDKTYNILVLTPAIGISWASDSHSMGFYIGDKICLSLEYSSYTEEGNLYAY
jgi:hypothetical protein